MQVASKPGQQWPFVHFYILSLTPNIVYMWQSSALFKSFLESVRFIVTNYYNYIIQPSAFQLSCWQSDYHCLTMKKPQQEQKYSMGEKYKALYPLFCHIFLISSLLWPRLLHFMFQNMSRSGTVGCWLMWELFNVIWSLIRVTLRGQMKEDRNGI